MKNEYFLYCRKSSEDKHKQQLSIPAQIREMRDFATKNTLAINRVFSEEKSARKPGRRQEFNTMIQLISNGKCKRILCWHTNRLCRNPEEAGMLHQMLADGKLLEIRTPYEVINANTNDIMLGVSFGSNSQYSKELSYNTKRGLREKVSRGEWPTLAPAFYVNVGDKKGAKNIAPDPLWGKYYEPWIDQIISNRLNLTQATQLLKTMGVVTKNKKGFSSSKVHRLLRMPVYYGLLQYADLSPVRGTWEPLITKAKWDNLQAVLDDKSKPPQTKHNHAYRKLLKCSRCGLHIVPYTKTKNGKQYTYYSCSKRNGNCGNPPTTLENLEEQLLEIISSVSIDSHILEQLKKLTKERLEKDYSFETDKRKEVDTKFDKVSKQLDRLLELRIGEELTGEEYAIAKKRLSGEKDHLESVRSTVGIDRDDMRKQLELFFDSAFNMQKSFTVGTLQEKTLMVYSICEEIWMDDKKLGWNFRSPWKQMVLVASEPNSDKWGS